MHLASRAEAPVRHLRPPLANWIRIGGTICGRRHLRGVKAKNKISRRAKDKNIYINYLCNIWECEQRQGKMEKASLFVYFFSIFVLTLKAATFYLQNIRKLTWNYRIFKYLGTLTQFIKRILNKRKQARLAIKKTLVNSPLPNIIWLHLVYIIDIDRKFKYLKFSLQNCSWKAFQLEALA